MDPIHAFDSVGRRDDLPRRAARGGLFTLLAQLARTAVQMLGTMILARLLTPEEYGLIGMATVVVGFAQMFKDAGLSLATVQQDHINEDQISTLFWVNLAISLALSLLVLASSPLLAVFYGHRELTGIVAALSVSFLISGIATQHEALLRRHLRFAPLAIAQVLAQTVNVGVAVGAAVLGFGYWALVYGTLASALVASVAVIYFCPWVPGRPRRKSGVKGMLRFGGDVVGFNVADYLARNADNILIGRFMGPGPLGLYTRAYQLFMLPMTQIRAPMADVAIPALSAVRDEPDRYLAYFRRFLDALALLTVPLALYCLLEAEFVISVLLGDQWAAAVPVFRLLAIAGVTQAIASTRGLVLVTHGLSKEYLKLGIANSLVTVAAIIVGLPFGIEGVALAYAVSNLGFFIPSLYLFLRGTLVVPRDFYRALGMPLLLGGVATLAAWLCRRYVSAPSWEAHALAAVVFIVVYFGFGVVTGAFHRTLRPLVRSLGVHGARPGGE